MLHRRRGVVLAELAVLLPFFLLILIGVLELGRAVMVRQELVNAAREGARRGVAPGATTPVIATTVNNYLTDTSLNGATVTVEVNDALGNPVNVATLSQDAAVHVHVEVPFAQVSWGIAGFFVKGNLQAEVVMRNQ